MSFLKNLTKEFKDLMGDDKDKTKDHSPAPYAQGGTPQQQPYGQQPSYGQQPYGQPQQHSQPQSYGHLQQYGSPTTAQSGPNLPPGWIQQWDQNSQRWYYVDTSSGRTQWEPPAFSPPPGHGGYGPPTSGAYTPNQGAPGADHTKGMFGGGQYGAPVSSPDRKKKKSGNGKLLAAGALGAIGGAVVAHEMTEDSSSDEERHKYSAPPAAYGGGSGYGYGGGGGGYGYDSGQGYGAPMAAPPPVAGSDISSSDAESLASAREDVIKAQEELAEASSESDRESAREDLEEAQEEYAEEYEEAYDD